MELQPVFTFMSMLLIVGGVLQIILFFKIWGMTNDVANIKEMLKAVKDILVVTNNDKPAVEIFKSVNSDKPNSKSGGFRWTTKASAGDKESYKDMEKLLSKGKCAIRKEGNPTLKIVDMDNLCEIEGNYDVICLND